MVKWWRAHLANSFKNDAATEFRLIGAAIGIAAFFFPWGSVIFTDLSTKFTYLLISKNLLDLVAANSALVCLGALLFIGSTLIAIVERYALVGQIIGTGLLLFSIGGYLGTVPSPSVPVDINLARDQTLLTLGPLLGLLSSIIILLSFRANKGAVEEARIEGLPNWQRPVNPSTTHGDWIPPDREHGPNS